MSKSLAQLALEKLETIQASLKIKLAAEPIPAPEGTDPEPSPATVTAKDGSVYRIEGEMVEGSEIYLQSEAGEEPAPDGVVELEDGTMLTITAGKIEKVEASPAGTDPMVADQTQMKAMMAAIDPTGTSTDPVKVMLKALMESQFGWQIREQEQKANQEAAIAAYKASMASLETKAGALTTELEALKATRKQENAAITEAMEHALTTIKLVAEAPNGGEPETDKRFFPRVQSGGGLLGRKAAAN